MMEKHIWTKEVPEMANERQRSKSILFVYDWLNMTRKLHNNFEYRLTNYFLIILVRSFDHPKTEVDLVVGCVHISPLGHWKRCRDLKGVQTASECKV